jgi:hypothetical protein
MKIDHYGQVLIGCIDCNRWGHPGDTKPVMELLRPPAPGLLFCQRGVGFPQRKSFLASAVALICLSAVPNRQH